MANAQSALEKLNKKYGIKSSTTSNKNDNRKQSTSASSKSTSASSQSSKTTNNKSKTALDKLNNKYGIKGTYNNVQNSTGTKKKYTDFNTETKNSYTSAKNKATTKTTIGSSLTENDRKARINEIESELKQLNTNLHGIGRASAYGNSETLNKMREETQNKIAELSKELKSLERTGTFTASELKQFEIDDTKAKKAALPSYNPTARITLAEADAFKKNVSEHFALDEKIDTLEREKELYDDISEFGDVVHKDDYEGGLGAWFKNFDSQWRANYRSNELSREAADAANAYIRNPTEENFEIAKAYKAFSEEYMKNNEKALDDENVKASWLTKSMAGYLPQLKDQILPEALGYGIGAALGSAVGDTKYLPALGAGLGVYAQSFDDVRGSVFLELMSMGLDEETALRLANDEAVRSAAIEGGESALSWAVAGFGGAKKAIGNAAKASVAKGSTNTFTKLAANMASKATNKAASKAASAVATPLWKTGVKTVGGMTLETGTEYLEEFSQGAVSVATREKAMAILDKEIGQYGAGNINLYNRPIYKNADGTMSTVDSATYIVDGKYLLLPTIVRDENGKATRLETDEEVIAHYEKTGEYLGVFDTEEEANGYANRLHYAQAYHYSTKSTDDDDGLWLGAGKVVSDAVTGKRPEVLGELHAQGKEGAKISIMTGGARITATNIITHYANAKTVKLQNEIADTIIQDEEALNTLIDEGKASGEGTVSEKLATEIETARANGETVTREKVKQLIASNEIYIKEEEKTAEPDTLEQTARDVVNERNRTSTPSYERLEALSQNNEQIAVEDVKKVTGFGEEGSKLVAELANNEGVTFSQAERTVKTAYLAGFSNVEGAKVNFVSDEQINAFTAGKKDRVMQDLAAKEKAKNATVYDGVFTENKYTKNWSNATKKMVSTVAKHFGMDIKTVDKIIANKYTGAEANALHQDGKMRISSTAEKLIHALVLHESGHRMEQFATAEWNELANFLYKRAERLGRRAELGINQGMAFDAVKAEHDNAGISMSTSGYINEIAVRELETIFSSPEEFNSFIAEIETNQQAKSAWGKFVEWLSKLIEDLKTAWSQRKMTAEEKAEARKALAEMERIKELYAKAYLATKEAVEQRKSDVQNVTTSTKNLEIKINEEYNGNINHSLKKKAGYNEYNTIGMQWAYDADTQIGDQKMLYNSYTNKFVLVKATKEGVGFVEVKSGAYNQMREEKEYYETEKQTRSGTHGNKETVDKVLRDFGVGRNNNDGDNVDAGNRGTGKQDAELLEGKPDSNGATDSKTSDGNLVKKNFSLKKTAPTFYSHMGKTIDDMKQDKIGANSVVSYLTGRGVKAEEIKWSGIETFLEGKKSVTKAELQEFVAGSMLQIDVKTVKDDITISYTQDELEELDRDRKLLDKAWAEANDIWNEAYGTDIPADIMANDDAPSAMIRYVIDQHGGMRNFEGISHLSDAERKIYDDYSDNSVTRKIKDLEEHQAYIAERAKARRDNTKQTKYHQYTLDGGSGNYRELLFKLPNSEYTNNAMSFHWGEGGILAHARVQDFDVNGQKMLFIEEIQSDWHNEGQKRGYQNKLIPADEKAVADLREKQVQKHNELKEVLDAMDDISSNSDLWDKATKLRNEEQAIWKEIQKLKGIGDVTDAPFRNNYHEYVLKNLIRMAAEDGYDSIGWTTADIQSERWSEAYAEGYRIEYDQDIPKFLNKYGKKWGAKVEKTVIGREEGHWEDKARWVEKEGNEVWTMPITDSMKDSVLYEGQPMFSLKKPVEETKNLIAVHNLWEEKLLKSLKLGGLPMPSIAIVRAREGHSNFGNISLVFRKETISPTDRRNKVYSGDAWTPTYPYIEYKVDEKERENIKKKIDALVPSNIQRDLGGLHLDSSNIESDLNRNGDMVSVYRYNYAMKYAFLVDNGINIELPTKAEPFYRYGEVSNDAVISFAHKMVNGLQTVNSLLEQHSSKLMSDTELIGTITSVLNEEMLSNIGENSEAYQKFVEEPLYKPENIDLSTVLGMLEASRRYFNANGRIDSKIDYREAQTLIDKKVDIAKYEAWVKDLFSNIVAKEGIRNDKDLFTPSGKRRSFEALHYEHTLENVVKAMKESGTIGIGGFGGNNILGSSAVEYGSISEIKEKANERMKALPQEEYDKIREGFTDRFLELANSLPIHKTFSSTDDAANMLCEAVMKYKTKSGMANYLRNESKGWANYSDYIVDDLVELVNDIRNMPTSYFEAKPQRAVGFNEIVKAIIPDNVSEELKTRLTENNVSFIEYEHGNNDARLEALNSLEDVQFSLKGTSDISSKDRKELLDIIEHLKGEFEITKFAKADPKKLAKMTREVLKEYNSQVDFDETYKAIDELYQYMANGEDGQPAVWEDVYNRAYDVAREIVRNAVVVDDYMYQEYKSLRDYLRKTPMKFYAGYDSVPVAYENFNDFRKMNMGRLKFAKDGVAIDAIYQELSSLYPEFFDPERENNTADQLEQIINVLDELQPTEVNPFDRQIEQVSMALANDITSRFFDIPQAKPTFADKAERRVVEAHIKGGKRVEAVRQQKDAKIKKLIEAQKEKTKKQLDKIREQRDTKVKKEQEKRRDAISKMSESQKAKVFRAQIIRHTSDLSKKLVNPTDNQHIPFELQGAVAKLLECINLESNYTYDTESHSYKKNDEGLPTRRTQAFHELQKVYADIASSVVVDPDLIGERGLLSGVISLADKRIADMTSSELETVWQTIRAIEASVSTANRVFSEGKFATILEVAEALRTANKEKISKTEFKGLIGKSVKLATLDMLTPETYLHCLGDAGDSIFRMMRDAQDKHISIMKEAADFTHKGLKDVDVNSLEKTLHTVKLGGEKIQLSTAQLMELYVLMKREQAIDHILVGGILPDVTEGKGLKLNTKTKPIRNISVDEISAAISKLTDEQKKVADKLQKYVSTVLSAYGNEASMKVYNYEKFLEKNYWTIRTNKQEISSDVDKDTAVTSVANKGMTKATKPHANTSVRIGSIFDTFASHSSDMATYAAWLGTSEDVNRIRNFVFWEDGSRKGTVKDILDTVHGTQGSKYLEKLLTDVAIGVKGTDNLNPFDKLIGHYKAASVGANLRVVIQQPTAILRALDMIDAHYLAEGAVRPLKGWGKAKKYAPIAQWKDWGYFDINTGRQMKDVLFDNASLLEKTKQAGMWGASKADSISWGLLWNAVEAETKAKHKDIEVGSDVYYETVAKRFTEIVDHTQVVDGILQRSQIMRSPDALTKMATSFMGEPTKQYNMAASAAYDAKNLKGDAKNKAIARLGRTAAALAVSGIINACAQSIIDAMRDDDKEKKYWERWVTSLIGDGDETKWYDTNLADVANPLNYIPFAKDVVSILRGYDVKRMDTEAITKVFDASRNMYKSVTGSGKYTIAEAAAQLFAEVARLYGVPVANVKRDIKSLVMSVAIETNNYLMQYRMEKAMLDINYAGNSKNFMDILFNSYNNDREAYEFIYKDMLDSGYEADKIKSGMETRMKKAEGVEKSSELSKRYMTPADEKKYDSSLSRVKSSQVWKSANAKQRKEAEADLYDFLTSTSEAMEKARAEARAYGVDETEYTLYQLAIEMADQPKGQKGSGSYDLKEKAEAINSLNLGDNEIAYFFGKGLNETAKEELNETLDAGIDIQEYVNFKAAASELKADKNAKGNSIPNSKKKKVVNYLNNADLTSEEWDYFYYEIMNYKK